MTSGDSYGDSYGPFLPVLLLGGQENTLALTRSLGSKGVPVYISAETTCVAARSRFCSRVFPYVDRSEAMPHWKQLLIEAPHPDLDGVIVLACSDDGLEFLVHEYDNLVDRYTLDKFDPQFIRDMLDKQRTLELARAAGCAVPNFWNISKAEDLDPALEEVRYPALVKPIHSHVFQRIFSKKHFITNSDKELKDGAAKALDAGIPFMLCEMIPGPDTLLSSYYTYMTEDEKSLFQFTKKVIRRFPVNQGGASYHVTEWLPETAEAGEKFFRGLGLRGLGNVEFKLDTRDGQLKVIECNARFTAAQRLLVEAGVDTGWLVYSHLTGRPLPGFAVRPGDYVQNLRLWYPERDYNAFRQLQGRGDLSWAGWLRSLAHKQVTPYHDFKDPMPGLSHLKDRAADLMRRKVLRR